jgi:hypothetical protein
VRATVGRGGADGLGQASQGPEPTLHLGCVQVRVIHVGVGVDQPDRHAAVEDLFR